jgi:glycosyltransferase involved in cell wall biosynthesis
MWRLFQRRDLLEAHGFVATSDDEARDIRDLGFQQPVAVIPNAVDVPSIPCESTSDRRTAVFLSRIHPKKGLLNLIRAWAIVRPASWKLVIAGPDEQGHAGQIRDEIQRLRLLDTVQIRGEVSESEKLKFLAQSAFAVLPSESENFGMVVAEAMSVGVPVIASTGTPWSALRERGIGWWVPNSPEDLASAIRDAISLFPSELRDKGLAARSFVEENYSWEAVGTKTASFYRWLTGGGERPEFVFIHSAR